MISSVSDTFFTSLIKSVALCVLEVKMKAYLAKWSAKRCRYFLVDLDPPKPPMVSIDIISNGFVAGPRWDIHPNFPCPLDLFLMHVSQSLQILVMFFVRFFAVYIGLIYFCNCLIPTWHRSSCTSFMSFLLNSSDRMNFSFFYFFIINSIFLNHILFLLFYCFIFFLVCYYIFYPY